MKKIPYLILALAVLLLDQLSKWFVTEYMVRTVLEKPTPKPLGFIEWYLNTPEKLPFIQTEVFPFFNIVMVWNKGMSFGMFNNLEGYGPIILTAVAILVTLWFLIWLFRPATTRFQSFAISLVIAGAIGNVIDRQRFGAVIDFLDFHIADLHWPAFNIADSCVVSGVFMLIIYSIVFDKPIQKTA